MTSVRTTVALWCGSLLLCWNVGCQSDSAGRNADVAHLQRPLVLSAEPVLTIGAVGSPESHELFRVANAFRSHDGGVVIADAGTRDIRFFDSSGVLLRTVGRDGSGPGEFRAIRSASRMAGDTVVVWDPTQFRVTLVDPGGQTPQISRLEATVSIQHKGQPVPAFPNVVHALDDGRTVVEPGFLTQAMTRGPDGIRRDTVPIFVFERTGRLAATLGPVAGADTYVRDRSSMPMPYGHRLFVATIGREVYVGTGIDPIDVFSDTGGLVRSIDPPLESAPVSDDAFSAMKDRWLSRMAPSARAGMAAMLSDMPKLESYPRYSRLLSSAEGDLWVKVYSEPTDSTQHWIALDRSGTQVLSAAFPAALEVLDAGRDFVLVLFRDELDSEQVRMYGLVPGA